MGPSHETPWRRTIDEDASSPHVRRSWWRRWRRPAWGRVALGVAGVVVCVAVVWTIGVITADDGAAVVDPARVGHPYLTVFALVTLDAVIPILPGESTLNAASTVAAQGRLNLAPIIVMGAMGAVVGDSALFWLARSSSRKVEARIARAREDERVLGALKLLDSSAPLLIVSGRYLPGMRFVVNASMGLSSIRYRRFLLWSAIGGTLWSIYTCVLAYAVAVALGDNPFAAFAISGVATTVIIGAVLVVVQRQRRRTASERDGAARPGARLES